MTLYNALCREIMDPNGGRLALSHHRATTAGAHALLGACAASGGVWWLGLAVAAWPFARPNFPKAPFDTRPTC